MGGAFITFVYHCCYGKSYLIKDDTIYSGNHGDSLTSYGGYSGNIDDLGGLSTSSDMCSNSCIILTAYCNTVDSIDTNDVGLLPATTDDYCNELLRQLTYSFH